MTVSAVADPQLRLPPDAVEAVEAIFDRARAERWVERLHDRDATLWSADSRVQAAIADRLGWLDAPTEFTDRIASIEGFAAGIHESGFSQALVMGMGGSSLAPEVFARVFGPTGAGIPVHVLDSTDPETVDATFAAIDLLTTLYVVASKSGTTAEALAFQAEGWERAAEALRELHAGRAPDTLFVAITDPGKSVDAIPHAPDFRTLFLNPTDVGGRYAALTYVGLVPAALLGMDLDALLAPATAMLDRCRSTDPAANPGASLGIVIAELARSGRDKLTLLADPELEPFGAWVEQLIAESTGKHATGIVPVDVEPPGPPEAYGSDRVFVRLALAPAIDGEAEADEAIDAEGAIDGATEAPDLDALVDDLVATGHPAIRIELADPIELGGEFVRWEVATAVAGIVLGIDPFDQPNVESSKDRTRAILDHLAHDRHPAPAEPPMATGEGLAVYGDAPLRLTDGDKSVVGELRRHLGRRRSNAYLAIGAFIAPSAERSAALARLRAILRNRTGCATTAAYGPRFLHSTGQLHKGGPASGWFLQLTADHPLDWRVPDKKFTFGQLIDAQAAGDFAALEAMERPILRVHLGADPDAGLEALIRAVEAALDTPT